MRREIERENAEIRKREQSRPVNPQSELKLELPFDMFQEIQKLDDSLKPVKNRDTAVLEPSRMMVDMVTNN
jgi:hypothetical protein